MQCFIDVHCSRVPAMQTVSIILVILLHTAVSPYLITSLAASAGAPVISCASMPAQRGLHFTLQNTLMQMTSLGNSSSNGAKLIRFPHDCLVF